MRSVADDKAPREYDAVFLENEYLKVMILPELGGRVQMALDKTNDYHFVYYNRVIKPALVGLAGPWISGGIEFNWPQHHRPSTFHPVDADIVANDDGSWTVWCSEIDRMAGTKGMHGFTLHPGKAYLEVRVRLFNRTPLPQTFLWWANPAVHVDENHQSIFPPDVVAVMDHGKRDVSSFPIATGTYYKVDYSPGTDISRYKNIPVPTSYMAYHSDYDFVGSYDHGRQAGLLHVARSARVAGQEAVDVGLRRVRPGVGSATHRRGRPVHRADVRRVHRQSTRLQLAEPRRGEIVLAVLHAVQGRGRHQERDDRRRCWPGGRRRSRATVRVYTTAARPQARVVLRSWAATLLDERFDATPARSS